MSTQEQDSEESSTRPRRLIHEIQEHAYGWHEAALNVHQEDPLNRKHDPDRVERILHNAVMQYWKVLSWFHDCDNERIEDLWTENESLLEGVERADTLEDVGDLRFETRMEISTKTDMLAGTVREYEESPYCLPVDQATTVLDALDKLAYELGFTARESSRTQRTPIDEDLVEDLDSWIEKNL